MMKSQEENQNNEDNDDYSEDFIKIKWRIKLLNYKNRPPFEAIAIELDEDEKGYDMVAVKIDNDIDEITLDRDTVVLLEDLIDDSSQGSKEFKEIKALFEKKDLEPVKEEDELSENISEGASGKL